MKNLDLQDIRRQIDEVDGQLVFYNIRQSNIIHRNPPKNRFQYFSNYIIIYKRENIKTILAEKIKKY